MREAVHVHRACPFLGLEEDAATSQAFPSVWNCCHRSRPVASVQLRHQREFCLTERYSQCLVYQRHEDAPLPIHYRGSRKPPSITRGFQWGKFSVVLAAGIAVLILALGILNRSSTPSLERTASRTSGPRVEPTATETAQVKTHIPTPSRTLAAAGVLEAATMSFAASRTAIASRTPASTLPPSSHQLEMPISTDRKFVLHQFKGGDTFSQYAEKYGTSVDAILAVNHDLQSPLWIDTVIVIPVGFTNVEGLPGFDSYQVTAANVDIELLAQELGVNLADLKYYNGIGAGDSLLAGDWLLIPRPESAP